MLKSRNKRVIFIIPILVIVVLAFFLVFNIVKNQGVSTYAGKWELYQIYQNGRLISTYEQGEPDATISVRKDGTWTFHDYHYAKSGKLNINDKKYTIKASGCYMTFSKERNNLILTTTPIDKNETYVVGKNVYKKIQ